MDVEGQNVDAATATLEAAGFIVVRQNVVDDSVAPGTVVGQSPAAGTDVPPDSTVTLFVAVASSGPVSATPVPTLSEWAMILMIALLAFIGGRRIRRWKSID